MFVVKYFNGKRTILQKEFGTLNKAESYVDNNPPEQTCKYEIFDTEEERIVEEGELEGGLEFDNQIMDLSSFEDDELDGYEIDNYGEDDNY